jgi:bisphosphoglycerate-dependent phosphoglycerate mutase
VKIKKLSELQKKLKLNIITYLSVIIIAIMSYWGITYYQNILENRRLSIKSTILTLRRKLTDIKTELNEVELAKKILEQSQDLNQKNYPGLQLDEAQSIIKYFEGKYNILNLSFDTTPPKDLSSEFSTLNFKILSSDINIKFAAMSDENAFQFVDALLTNFSGFKLVKSFHVQKQNQITNSVLKSIQDGKKPSIVKAELVFEWRNFDNL